MDAHDDAAWQALEDRRRAIQDEMKAILASRPAWRNRLARAEQRFESRLFRLVGAAALAYIGYLIVSSLDVFTKPLGSIALGDVLAAILPCWIAGYFFYFAYDLGFGPAEGVVDQALEDEAARNVDARARPKRGGWFR